MVNIVDSTLRDGEQAAGIALGVADKVAIAQQLDLLGVPFIEAGTPAMGGTEQEAISTIASLGLRAKVFTWNRAKVGDIRASLDCGVRQVHISIPVSDLHIQSKLRRTRGWVLDTLPRAVAYARDHGCSVTVGAEDASRADMDFLVQLAAEVRSAGALWLRYADTVGRLDPFSTYEAVKRLTDTTGTEVEIHTHNDFGMATANALAGIKAGARYVSTTINGLGERAGNAPLDEVAAALHFLWRQQTGIRLERLVPLSRLVAKIVNRRIPEGKAISGAGAFTSEIDAGMAAQPHLYRPFDPQELGCQNRLVLGKHTTPSGIRTKCRQLTLPLTNQQALVLTQMVRGAVTRSKRALSDEEFVRLYKMLM